MPRSNSAALALAEPVIDAAPLTPERQRLSNALAEIADLKVRIAEAGEKANKARSDYYDASRELEAAERTLERAKPQPVFNPGPQSSGHFWSSQEAYDAHVAEESAPPISIAEARALVATATDTRDSAQRARQFYEKQASDLAQSLSWRQGTIRDAVRGVLRSDPALAALVAESKRLHTRAAAAAAAVEAAIGGDTLQPDSPFYHYDKPSHHSVDFEGWAASRLWHEAVERLATDATTPLPMVQPS